MIEYFTDCFSSLTVFPPRSKDTRFLNYVYHEWLKLDEPDNSSTRAYQAIWLCFIFGGRCLPRWNRSGLFWVRPDNSHCPVLTVEECWQHRAHNPKTDIVVAVGRATIRRIIVPGTAPFTDACPDINCNLK